MNSSELRTAFLNFFTEKKGHTQVSSSPLVPGNDPTLLFTNAGMVQFKEIFLGLEQRSYTRAVTAQRCVRAGGKHNDLENVGYTARHHTFFEMLGNFSFGDYFKREAITYAWEFLTQVLKLPAEKLWVTVYEDDDEAADIWLNELKVDPARFSRCGAADNFWMMGDTGPCGPCSEVFYDHGPEVAGGPPGTPEADGDRYIEIWNLVFMQYERSTDGQLTPLPRPSIDTGMGLERLAAVLQGVHNNYDIDLFQNLIRAIADLAQTNDLTNTSLRVIADHIRSSSFLITDGVLPSNEGRGYVLRRIIRRAIRHGNKVGLTDLFLFRLVAPLVKEMGVAYPELAKAQALVERVLRQEEEQFARTLELGLKIFEQDVAALTSNVIPGATVFRLYDTYGFPVDLTADMARERNLLIDLPGFEQEMAKQRRQSQEASKFGVDYHTKLQIDYETNFVGYEKLEQEAQVIGLFCKGQKVDALQAGDSGSVVLDHTPFYAESGGQVGDQGEIHFQDVIFSVTDTRKEGAAIIHQGHLKSGALPLAATVIARVNAEKRQATALNHSATHLLHAALRQLLGEQITQKGSLVAPDRLRFDFSHFEPVSPEQITLIEHQVNQQIRANYPVETEVMSTEAAMNSGAMALFGEKYGERVRVLRMGDFSMELCGGTHVQQTGDIGLFKIISESGIASGVRRIEAITGECALDWLDKLQGQMQKASQLLKSGRDDLNDKLQQLLDRNKTLEKQIEQLQGKQLNANIADLIKTAEKIGEINVLAVIIPETPAALLRNMVDDLKQKLDPAVIVLASLINGQINVTVGVSKKCVGKISAQDLVSHIAGKTGGKGGGRADLAQAGGGDPETLEHALQSVVRFLRDHLS